MPHILCRVFVLSMFLLPLAPAVADDSLIHHVEFVNEGKTDPLPQLLGDRFAYWNDDPLGRFRYFSS
jgi:hypothetical protein